MRTRDVGRRDDIYNLYTREGERETRTRSEKKLGSKKVETRSKNR
jgi:hypothetical protein